MARFGMVSKLLAHPGRRSELMELLPAATREVHGADGCELYVGSQDRDDLDKIRVFEAWRDEEAHPALAWTCRRSAGSSSARLPLVAVVARLSGYRGPPHCLPHRPPSDALLGLEIRARRSRPREQALTWLNTTGAT